MCLPFRCHTKTYVVGSLTIPEGWYNLPSLLKYIDDDGVVSMTWTASTNVVASSANITLDTAQAQSMLGWGSGAASASSAAPGATWAVSQGDLGKRLSPVGVNGRKTYDSEFYTTQDGNSFALGSVSQKIEDFEINLVLKDDLFSFSGNTSVTAPLIDSVYAPYLGLDFELAPDSPNWATGYSEGPYWCIAADIKADMAMYPWDKFFNISFSAYCTAEN